MDPFQPCETEKHCRFYRGWSLAGPSLNIELFMSRIVSNYPKLNSQIALPSKNASGIAPPLQHLYCEKEMQLAPSLSAATRCVHFLRNKFHYWGRLPIKPPLPSRMCG